MDDWTDEPEAIDEAEVEALHQVHLAQRALKVGGDGLAAE